MVWFSGKRRRPGKGHPLWGTDLPGNGRKELTQAAFPLQGRLFFGRAIKTITMPFCRAGFPSFFGQLASRNSYVVEFVHISFVIKKLNFKGGYLHE